MTPLLRALHAARREFRRAGIDPDHLSVHVADPASFGALHNAVSHEFGVIDLNSRIISFAGWRFAYIGKPFAYWHNPIENLRKHFELEAYKAQALASES